MRTIYIAVDNKEFDDELECEILKHPYLKDIKCYDKDGNLFTDIMDDDTYNYSVKIVVPTEECVKELHYVAEYTGFIYYYHITEPGIWVFKQDDNRADGRFVKV